MPATTTDSIRARGGASETAPAEASTSRGSRRSAKGRGELAPCSSRTAATRRADQFVTLEGKIEGTMRVLHFALPPVCPPRLPARRPLRKTVAETFAFANREPLRSEERRVGNERRARWSR